MVRSFEIRTLGQYHIASSASAPSQSRTINPSPTLHIPSAKHLPHPIHLLVLIRKGPFLVCTFRFLICPPALLSNLFPMASHHCLHWSIICKASIGVYSDPLFSILPEPPSAGKGLSVWALHLQDTHFFWTVSTPFPIVSCRQKTST